MHWVHTNCFSFHFVLNICNARDFCCGHRLRGERTPEMGFCTPHLWHIFSLTLYLDRLPCTALLRSGSWEYPCPILVSLHCLPLQPVPESGKSNLSGIIMFLACKHVRQQRGRWRRRCLPVLLVGMGTPVLDRPKCKIWLLLPCQPLHPQVRKKLMNMCQYHFTVQAVMCCQIDRFCVKTSIQFQELKTSGITLFFCLCVCPGLSPTRWWGCLYIMSRKGTNTAVR